MKILSFFSIFFGHFCPPGSGSAICMRIRIQKLKLMRIRIRNPVLQYCSIAVLQYCFWASGIRIRIH